MIQGKTSMLDKVKTITTKYNVGQCLDLNRTFKSKQTKSAFKNLLNKLFE